MTLAGARADIPYAEVIGDPIAHSKSPLIHGFWLKELGLEADYRACHVRSEDLPEYIAGRRADPLWRGCNVTIPHKIAMLDLVDDPGDVRTSIGAMNSVIRNEQGDLIGTNTDAGGFYAPIADLDLSGRPVAVIGAGGAARAVLFALSRAGCGPVTLFARNAMKGMGLLASFGLKGEVAAMDAPLPPAALLVNTSPLGMKGFDPLPDYDLSVLPDDALVYDIVYVPLDTALLQSARSHGLETMDGMEMLIGQAALAFELFFGKAPPRERDDALRALLTA
ncbi:MAG: shikimate dehydrogenase [Blastomonas sp.]